MAMLVDIDWRETLQAEYKVAEASAKHNTQAQPAVVGHEHQHEHVAHGYLKHVKQCLYQMSLAQ